MHAQEWRAIEALGHRQLALDLACVPHSVQVRVRFKRDLAQSLLDTDTAQNSRRVGQHLDASANACELRSLFVDVHVNADLPQGAGSGKAAHSSSNDSNRRPVLSHVTSFRSGSSNPKGLRRLRCVSLRKGKTDTKQM